MPVDPVDHASVFIVVVPKVVSMELVVNLNATLDTGGTHSPFAVYHYRWFNLLFVGVIYGLDT
jgi:hypothetical protein